MALPRRRTAQHVILTVLSCNLQEETGCCYYHEHIVARVHVSVLLITSERIGGIL
jgi:hypothetical protein